MLRCWSGTHQRGRKQPGPVPGQYRAALQCARDGGGVYFDPGLSIWVLTKGDGRGLRGSMPFAETFIVIACYAIGINLAGFLAFAWDKHCARNGMWRVPERTLLTLAAVGGTIRVIVGQRALRHKTYKQPFRTVLLLIFVFQVLVVLASSVPLVWGDSWTSSQRALSQQASPQRASPRRASDQGPRPKVTRH